MPSLRALGLLALGLTAACTSSLADDAHLRADEAQAVDPDYLVFGSHAEASTWLTSLAPSLAPTFGAFTAPLPADDPRAAQVRAVVAAHWVPITERFAPAVSPPQVLLVESTRPDAVVLFDKRVRKIADAVVISTALLAGPPEHVDAMVAHELGHLVMKDVDPARGEAMIRYYAVGSGPEPIGMLQPDDPAVRAVVAPWRKTVAGVGAFSAKELNGWLYGAGVMPLFFSRYTAARFDASLEACVTFRASATATNEALRATPNDGIALTGTPEQLAKLDAATRAVEASAAACLRPPPGQTLYQAMSETLGVPVTVLESSATPEELAVVTSASDPLAALFTLVRGARAELRAAEEAHDFRAFRMYTGEEQADDFAMTLLALEGKDPTLTGRAILASVPDPIEAACEARLDASPVPAYGGLLQPHHAPCYRVFHSTRFAAHLASGGAGVAAPPAE